MRGADSGNQRLLPCAFAVPLRQQVIEGDDQTADLFLAVPTRAQRVVADLPQHKAHRRQDQRQQRQRRAQLRSCAREKTINARVQQAAQWLRRGGSGRANAVYALDRRKRSRAAVIASCVG
jgi:hypothetical protein